VRCLQLSLPLILTATGFILCLVVNCLAATVMMLMLPQAMVQRKRSRLQALPGIMAG
jgi:hypothetical protein